MGSVSFLLSFGADEILYLTGMTADQVYSLRRNDRKEKTFSENEVGQLVAKVIYEDNFVSNLKRKAQQEVSANLKKVLSSHLIK